MPRRARAVRFHPGTKQVTSVEDARTEAIWGGADLACRPCYDGREFAACVDNHCMKDISVVAVADRAFAMLARVPDHLPSLPIRS